jgi:hypothetical protein
VAPRFGQAHIVRIGQLVGYERSRTKTREHPVYLATIRQDSLQRAARFFKEKAKADGADGIFS